MDKKFDLTVIGSGPGGYVAAIKSAQLGMKTAVVEEKEIGGVCLNWGCIPTKALIKNAEVLRYIKNSNKYGITVDNFSFDFSKAIERSRRIAGRLSKGVEYLFKKNKITLINGRGILNSNKSISVLDNTGSDTDKIESENIIIASGSRPKSLPFIKIDNETVLNSSDALILSNLPKSIAIIGAGAVGIEFAYIFAAYGVQVILIELMTDILPFEDREITQILRRSLKKIGIQIINEFNIEEINKSRDHINIKLKKDNIEKTIDVEKILLAVGRIPNSEKLGLENLQIETEDGFIKVNKHLQTNVDNIFAFGDVIGAPLLAHKASYEGIKAVEFISLRKDFSINYNLIPGCVYCKPELASVGITEKDAKEKGIDIKIGKFPFRANGKAAASGEEDGMVKIVADKKTGKILGVHIVGPNATDIISEAGTAMFFESTVSNLDNIVHPHPTYQEAIMEAAMDAENKAIHI